MTKLLYYQDAYLREMDAHILEINREGAKKWQIILDQTIFYPMGGGQPTDQGFLSTPEWKGKVYQVLHKGDKIIHYVETEQPPSVGTSIHGVIDWERRYLNMRLHSAAHVIDFALYLLGYSPQPLFPIKGDSGKTPYIVYQGIIEEDFREALEKKALDLIAQDLPFSFKFVSYEELEREALYLQPGLPKNKPLRLLTLQGIGSVADGGTQVNRTAEIGSLVILPLEKKEGMTIIHYRLP